jgi:hypothetical protein
MKLWEMLPILLPPPPIPYPRDWSLFFGGGPLVWLTIKSVEKLLSMREDPKLRELSEKLRKSNEMYATARKVAESHKNEIKALRREIEELLKCRDRDRERMDRLVARFVALMSQMQREAA